MSSDLYNAILLIVNDDESTQRLLRCALEKQGFTHLLVACNAREAIQQLNSHTVDMLITDIHMPGMDGWRLARMVRSGLLECAGTIPIMLVSATYTDRITQITAREYGIDRFFALAPGQGLDGFTDGVVECLRNRGQGLRKPGLLIIEDDPGTALLASRMLQCRFSIETAADGETGLEAWRARRHDLVLLDMMLPKRSGAEVLTDILEKSPAQAVVIMTANASAELSEAMMLDGASDFISKPFETESLRRVCEIALRRHELILGNEKSVLRHRAMRQMLVEIQNQKLALDQHCIVAVFDAQGRFTYVNGKFSEVSQYSCEEVLGQDDSILNSSHHSQSLFSETWDTLRSGNLWRGEICNRKKDGSLYWVDATLVPLLNGQGKPYQYFGIYTDLTEHKQVEAELTNARDHALESVRLKSEFLATMSHEIRTPMNAIMGMAELLQDTALDAEQSDCLGTLRQSGENLLRIINDVLDFSKIEAGKLHIECVDFRLPEVIEPVLDALTPCARQKRISLTSYVAPEIPPVLRGDAGRIRQVLINLVGNAIKFSAQGSVTVRLTLELGDDTQSTVRISVADAGIGIPAQVIKKLFQPFTQADGSTTRKYGGTGLGLSICRNLVSMMGGEIGVDSDPGKGSTFWFTLSFMHGTAQDGSLHGSTPPDGAGAQSENASPAGLRKSGGSETGKAPDPVAQPTADAAPEEVASVPYRILLAEDNAVNRKLALMQLKKIGYRADVAEDGHAVLAAMQSTRYDLILMDCQMPEMDGYETTRAIRAVEQHSGAHIPIIAITANAMEGDRERCMEAGMDDYLAKPISVAAMREKLAHWLKGAGVGAPGQADQAGDMVVIDRKTIDRLYELQQEGEPDIVAEMIGIYLSDTPVLLTSAGEALAGNDAKKLRRVAHSLKSTSAHLGAVRLYALCKDMEESARLGDLQNAPAAFAEISAEYPRVLQALNDLLAHVQMAVPRNAMG